ncbi:MAG TPA: cytochrome c oxidase assembly protein [Gemmatimonadales bacterium]|nr:cytochrome c oxidase assembly protein [Gemmatimonadales bacterium]
MTWWCSARDVAWTWTWQAYPGVWLFVLGIGAGYFLIIRRLAPRHAPPEGPAVRPMEVAAFVTGLLVLWIATDWPVGALGAGYLLTVHTAQWILYTLVVPPFLILGVPEWCSRAPAPGSRAGRAQRILARPIVALMITDAILLTTHLPPVVDGFRRSQFGSFVVDLAWLVGGLVMWWPVLAPNPAISRVSYPWKIGYLFLCTLVPIVPAAFLTYADYPVYALYELAPRVNDISAITDQQSAGLIMKAVADPIIWLAMAIVFFRWQRVEEAADRAEKAARRAGQAGKRGSGGGAPG